MTGYAVGGSAEPVSRQALLRSWIPLDARGLEVGPGYNPLVPKAEGFCVETADYTDQEGLRAKYEGNPHVDPSRIEAVDHVLTDGMTLAEVVGRPGAFDYIVASHVIEHTPDMLGFLKSCEQLLSPNGVLLLAVPDKRHCFDVLLPLTSTGAVLDAHVGRHSRPSPGAVFNDLAYNAVRGDAIGWAPTNLDPLRFFASLHEAASVYSEMKTSSAYRDTHVWRFVPSSFRLIVGDLHAIGEIGLREKGFHDSVGNEFYLILSRSGDGCPIDRLMLAKLALREQAMIELGL